MLRTPREKKERKRERKRERIIKYRLKWILIFKQGGKKSAGVEQMIGRSKVKQNAELCSHDISGLMR